MPPSPFSLVIVFDLPLFIWGEHSLPAFAQPETIRTKLRIRDPIFLSRRILMCIGPLINRMCILSLSSENLLKSDN